MAHDEARFRGEGGVAVAEKVIDLIVAHDCATTPANYEIWFAYKLSDKPELNAQIDARIRANLPIDDSFIADLNARYFIEPTSGKAIAASESMARELGDIVATLRDAGENAGLYAGALDQAASAFERGVDAASFPAVVGGLAAATRSMVDQNNRLVQQMAESKRQVETLQSALQAVKVEASTDGLTGLFNRRVFDEELKARLEKTTSELCLLMCDIDHFKRFNDTWGHQVGDQVIRFIANVLQRHVEGDFIAARYGGEEFALIMPATQFVRAREVADSILSAVKSKKLTRKSTGEMIGAVTVSIGLARHVSGERAAELIGRADACLYASKRRGRDRVTTDTDLRASPRAA